MDTARAVVSESSAVMKCRPLTEEELRQHPECRHLPLVYRYAADFLNRNCRDNHRLEHDDLVSVGWICLRQAWDTYDPRRGCTFATYAGRILFRKFWDMYHEATLGLFVPHSTRRYALRGSSNYTRQGGKPRKTSEKALRALQGIRHAFPALPMADPNGPERDERDHLEHTLCRLSTAHQHVLRAFFLRAEKLKDIAVTMGVSRQAVHQLKDQALGVLTRKMTNERDRHVS